jgi:hypothetical protein
LLLRLYRRPEGLLHPLLAGSIQELKWPEGLLHPVVAGSIQELKWPLKRGINSQQRTSTAIRKDGFFIER